MNEGKYDSIIGKIHEGARLNITEVNIDKSSSPCRVHAISGHRGFRNSKISEKALRLKNFFGDFK